ncbi:tetratricopeptide repeat protein [Desulfosarcina ovata]|uniref:O-GlcNAc transferase n=1 Tax=Desulfosarcina ovata subsp. ovata TaxID=2752305 RepID=A0A5K8A4B7_9BACT|nr:tetratricopeptide repeat protein [Desulfosarcina ovata]BBO87385.1 O-GlcNAc transferase [Desulfosarcina ovata subsp. ovata]
MQQPLSDSDSLLNLNLDRTTGQTALALLLLFIGLIVVYAASFSGAWIYDDEANILSNKNIHIGRLTFKDLSRSIHLQPQDPGSAERIKRPLAYMSFAINWYFGKNRVFGYHLVNFCIHFISAAFLYLFITRALLITKPAARYRSMAHPIALLSAFIWAIHPIQVSAVTYIVQRMASMAGMFTIMSMYAYLRFRMSPTLKGKAFGLAACAICGLCALGTKENSAMLPLSLFFLEVLLIQGPQSMNLKKTACRVLPALAAVVLIGLFYVNPLDLIGGYANRPFTPMERILTEPRVVLYYLKVLFYPLLSEMTLVHDIEVSTSLWSPWSTLPSILTIGALFFGALFWLSKKQPLVAFAVVFFFINHLIEGSFISLELIYEHRNYIPSMFIFVIPALLLINVLAYFSYSRKFQLFVVISGAIVLATIGHSSFAYSHLFRNGLIFWKDNAEKSPRLSIVQNNYGIELLQHGFNHKALAYLQRAEQLNRYFNLSQQGVTYHNLGIYHETVEHDFALALTYFEKAMSITAHSKKMGFALCMSYLLNGNVEKARSTLDDLLKKWPDEPDFLLLMGNIRLMAGDPDKALVYARFARRAKPDAVEALAVYGEAYRLKGAFGKARFFWQAYHRECPNSFSAALALLDIFYQAGDNSALCRLIADLAIKKGSQSWDSLLRSYHSPFMFADALFYAVNREQILSIISNSLRKELETIDQHP